MTLLHGFMQDRTSWYEVIERAPEGFQWVLVDLPGHGGSAAEPATMEAAAAALAGLWDALGFATTHLVGYSLGGRLALYTSVRHPARLASLLTLGAHAGLDGADRERRRREDAALAARIEAEGIGWFAADWARRPLFAGLRRRGPDLLAGLDAMRRRQAAAGVAASLRGMGPAAVEPFWDALAAARYPATFAAGAEDAAYVEHARRLHALVPGSRAALVLGAGHPAHLEQPEAFAELLAAHLARHAATA